MLSILIGNSDVGVAEAKKATRYMRTLSDQSIHARSACSATKLISQQDLCKSNTNARAFCSEEYSCLL